MRSWVSAGGKVGRWSGARSTRGKRKTTVAAALAAATVLPVLAACGSDYTPGVLNIYAAGNDVAFVSTAADKCTEESNGAYKLVTRALPKGADDQRLQLARRLAGNDKGVDMMMMDVVWTAEFAEAGWLRAVPEDVAERARAATLEGPVKTATWKTKHDDAERLYVIPAWTNSQLLWYRPDVLRDTVGRGGKAPATWDEMLADAKASGAKGGPTQIMVQGKQYEGLVVWFNSVLASAGGQVVDPDDPDKITLTDTPEHRAATVKALQILKAVATAPGRDPSLTNANEDAGRLGMEKGDAIFQINWPFVFSSMRANAAAGSVPFLEKEMAPFRGMFADEDNPPAESELGPVNKVVRTKFNFAPFPAAVPGKPAKSTVGGINLGVADTTQQPELAFQAAECLTSAASQKVYALEGSQPPVNEALYDDPDFRTAYPFGDVIREQLTDEHSTTRPALPDYQAISTLLAAKLSPVGDWDPETLADELAEAVRKAMNGEGLIP